MSPRDSHISSSGQPARTCCGPGRFRNVATPAQPRSITLPPRCAVSQPSTGATPTFQERWRKSNLGIPFDSETEKSTTTTLCARPATPSTPSTGRPDTVAGRGVPSAPG
jgi:hypothetical protein